MEARTISAGSARLRAGIGRELVTFAAVGVVSTAAYAALYLLLRTVAEPVPASAAAPGASVHPFLLTTVDLARRSRS